MTLIDTRTSPAEQAPARRARRRLAERLLFMYTWLVIIWLVLPIGVMILFGFNDTQSRINQTWQGFTLKWYGRIFDIPALTSSLWISLAAATATMVIAGALGTLIGVALGRYRFRGHGTLNLVMFAVIASPELVMGASLLTYFVSLNVGRGFLTILVAHVMFSISFVAVVVRARVLTLDRFTEEAARDLGAGPWTTFWLVTFPSIFPAVLSGALLAFALSIDDFVITQFAAGTTIQTFPLWVWGATRVGLPPQVNIMGTLIFAVGVLIAITTAVVSRRRSR